MPIVKMSITDSRIIELLAENEKLKKSLKASEQKNKRLENKVNDLKAENKKLSKENAKMLNEKNDLNWKMGVSVVEKHKLAVKIHKLKMENENCMKENRKLKKENDNIQEKVAIVRKEKVKLEEDNKNLKIAVNNNCDEILLLKEVIIKKDKVLHTILEENKIIKKKLSDQKNILEILTLRLRTTEKNHYEFHLHNDLLIKKLRKKNRRLFCF